MIKITSSSMIRSVQTYLFVINFVMCNNSTESVITLLCTSIRIEVDGTHSVSVCA